MNKNFDLISVYAHAFLFSCSEKKVNWNLYLQTNNFLIDLFDVNKSPFWLWLRSLKLVHAKKELTSVFANRIDPLWLNLLFILIEDYQLSLLPSVLQLIKKLLHQKLGIKSAFVYSMISLNADQLLQIKKKLEKKLNCLVDLTAQLDTNLIAGVRLEVANQVFDNSFRKKLDDFCQLGS